MNNLLGQFEWRGPQGDVEKAYLDHHQKEYEESLAVQLATAQERQLALELENKRLREAFKRAVRVASTGACPDTVIKNAMPPPPDDSALREFVADEMIKMGRVDTIKPNWLADYAERYRKGDVK